MNLLNLGYHGSQNQKKESLAIMAMLLFCLEQLYTMYTIGCYTVNSGIFAKFCENKTSRNSENSLSLDDEGKSY